MYCLHCQNEYEKEMFCPKCGRMLVSDRTFDYQNNEEYQKDYIKEELTAEKQRIKREQEKLKDQHIPKCPICGSTDLKKLSAINRGISFGVFGFASNKVGKTYECQNCKATF